MYIFYYTSKLPLLTIIGIIWELLFKLRFGDVAVPNKDEIATIPETEVVPIPIPTADYSIEPLQDLESIHEDPQKIKIKLKRKRILADKNTKLSHKVIRKWISNVNGHTVVSSFRFCTRMNLYYIKELRQTKIMLCYFLAIKYE